VTSVLGMIDTKKQIHFYCMLELIHCLQGD